MSLLDDSRWKKHGERYATVITDDRGNASCLRSTIRDPEQLLFAARVDIDVYDASGNIAEYKKYSVVIFIQESEVEVIASSWLVDKNGVKWHCSRSLNAVNKLIRKRNSPGEDWNTIPIRILGFSKSFRSANKKVILGQDTSNIGADSSQSEQEQYRFSAQELEALVSCLENPGGLKIHSAYTLVQTDGELATFLIEGISKPIGRKL
ncbi:hypothetical protein AVEN_149445-1 [Araneus ventricosus]|uniref:Uncharacterized protein n=1 Tax=Araneus ventricosus TaxID=182803 RepID=A0A4Y2JG16_ARAVE|nr:hypothetical protein AVEN_149445-1 [Araneus ventricosus]